MGQQQQDGTGVFRPLEENDPRTVAGYRLTARLGSGGMGKVYLSYTPGGRPVAVKVIRPDFAEDPEFRRRFQQEVAAAQRVQGLYTAPVIDSDTDGRHPWLATAYVPGPSLAQAVTEHGPLPVPTVLLTVAGMAEALQVIHGAGIVHRDLKPSNVLLAADGPRVIDFGIARAADATSLTGSGVAVGTPSFMAPEQAAGRPVTPATDIFALGQVAVFASTGVPAFGEGTSHGVLYRIVHEEPVLDGVPDRLRELVTRCLAKDPADRPSVAEVVALCRSASGETQLRRPEEWLPVAVAADITGRTAAPAPDRTPPPPAAPPAVPAAHPAHAPTAPAHAPAAAAPPGVPGVFGAPVAPVPGSYGPVPPGSYGRPPQGGPYPAPAAQGTAAPAPASPGPGKRGGRTVALAVAAALVVGLGGGAAAYRFLDGGSGSTGASGSRQGQDRATGSPQAAQDAAPTADPASGHGTPSGPASPGAGGAAAHDPEPVSYQGIDLTGGYHLSLADGTDSPVNGSSGDFAYSYVSDAIRTTGSMVLLDPGQQGSLDVCRSETRFTDRIDLARLVKGTQICVRTEAGHLGLIVVRALPSETAAAHYMTVDATVWRNAIEVDDE
ncbi:serine/threonine-protein kinase [Streptomyces sp. NPDC001493]